MAKAIATAPMPLLIKSSFHAEDMRSTVKLVIKVPRISPETKIVFSSLAKTTDASSEKINFFKHFQARKHLGGEPTRAQFFRLVQEIFPILDAETFGDFTKLVIGYSVNSRQVRRNHI